MFYLFIYLFVSVNHIFLQIWKVNISFSVLHLFIFLLCICPFPFSCPWFSRHCLYLRLCPYFDICSCLCFCQSYIFLQIWKVKISFSVLLLFILLLCICPFFCPLFNRDYIYLRLVHVSISVAVYLSGWRLPSPSYGKEIVELSIFGNWWGFISSGGHVFSSFNPGNLFISSFLWLKEGLVRGNTAFSTGGKRRF